MQDHLPLEQALAGLTLAPRREFAEFLRRGDVSVELYRPEGKDRQSPHAQDEIYVIASGSGWLVNGDKRHHFQAGDLLFVPAGRVHRFEDFSADFATWVIFFGPQRAS